MKKILLILAAILLSAISFADTHKVHYEQSGEGTFTVKYRSSDYRYYTLPNDSAVDEGTSIQIYAKAPTDKSIVSLTINGTDHKSELKSGYYTFTVGSEDVDIVCTFESEEPAPTTKYAVTGEIEGEGTLGLNYLDGSWLTLESGTELAEGTWVRIRPQGSTGYKLKEVTLNGEALADVTEGNYYSCQVGTKDMAFKAVFEKDESIVLCPVKIIYHAGPGVVEEVKSVYAQQTYQLNYPTENEETTFNVNQNDYLDITMEPSEDCYIKSLLFNGTEYVSRVSSSTSKCTWRTPMITSTTETTTIEITFDATPEPVDYTVYYSVADPSTGTMTITNGTTTVASGSKITEGTTLHASFTPADGYELSALTVNGSDAMSYVHGLTFDFGVDNNLNIIATFTEETGINGVSGSRFQKVSNACYDLTGRKVSTAAHGLFILNGKKIIK